MEIKEDMLKLMEQVQEARDELRFASIMPKKNDASDLKDFPDDRYINTYGDGSQTTPKVWWTPLGGSGA